MRKVAKRVIKEDRSAKKVISKVEKEIKGTKEIRGMKAVLHLMVMKKTAPQAEENLPIVRVRVQMKAVKRVVLMDSCDNLMTKKNKQRQTLLMRLGKVYLT